MATTRTKKKSAKRSSRRVPRRTEAATVALSAELSLEQRLTAEILALDRAHQARVARDIVEIGARLYALQQHLGFGHWLSWLSEHLPYSPRTAQRYIAVARWADEFREDYVHFEHLGIGKLALLATLSPSARARFRRQTRFTVPGRSGRKTLEIMSREELAAVISGASQLAARPAALPPAKILQRFTHRVAGLDAMADQIRAHAEALPAGGIQDAADALQAVVDELRSVLG